MKGVKKCKTRTPSQRFIEPVNDIYLRTPIKSNNPKKKTNIDTNTYFTQNKWNKNLRNYLNKVKSVHDIFTQIGFKF